MGFFTKNDYKKHDGVYGEAVIETVKKLRMGRIVGTAAIALLVLILLFNSFAIIPTGCTGIRVTCGQISPVTLQAGFTWKIPFFQQIITVNNKQQDMTFGSDSAIWGETQEKVPVFFSNVTVSFSVGTEKSAWIYSNITNYTENLVSAPLVSSALKEASVTFSAEEVTNRTLIEPMAQEKLQAALNAKYGENTVYVYKVVINNMDFEDSYNEAINRRSLAQKEKEAQEIENQTAIAKAEADAKVSVTEAEAKAQQVKISAQADAEAAKIAADAEAYAIEAKAQAEAKANGELAASLTDEVLKNKYYETWDGTLPKVVTGSDGNTLIGIDGIE